jgi:hypothetical protein
MFLFWLHPNASKNLAQCSLISPVLPELMRAVVIGIPFYQPEWEVSTRLRFTV